MCAKINFEGLVGWRRGRLMKKLLPMPMHTRGLDIMTEEANYSVLRIIHITKTKKNQHYSFPLIIDFLKYYFLVT
jgi:hypothetical protein